DCTARRTLPCVAGAYRPGGMALRRLRFRWAAAALALLVLGTIAAVERADVVAQWRALVVLTVTLHAPGLTTAVDAVTGTPALRAPPPRRAPAHRRQPRRRPKPSGDRLRQRRDPRRAARDARRPAGARAGAGGLRRGRPGSAGAAGRRDHHAHPRRHAAGHR